MTLGLLGFALRVFTGSLSIGVKNAVDVSDPFVPLLGRTGAGLCELVMEQVGVHPRHHLLLGGGDLLPSVLLEVLPHGVLRSVHAGGLLVGKHLVQYFLALVAAAVDARGLREAFDDLLYPRRLREPFNRISESGWFVIHAFLLVKK